MLELVFLREIELALLRCELRCFNKLPYLSSLEQGVFNLSSDLEIGFRFRVARSGEERGRVKVLIPEMGAIIELGEAENGRFSAPISCLGISLRASNRELWPGIWGRVLKVYLEVRLALCASS